MTRDDILSLGWDVLATLFLAVFVYVISRAPVFALEAAARGSLGLTDRIGIPRRPSEKAWGLLDRWVRRGERAAAVVALPMAVALAIDIRDGAWSPAAQALFVAFALAILAIIVTALGLLAFIGLWLLRRWWMGPSPDGLLPLAGFTGKLASVTHKELAAHALWERPVRVVKAMRWTMTDLREGQTGRIGFTYPASASLYNAAREVPVTGLDAMHNLGVAWEALALIPDVADPDRRRTVEARARRIFGAMAMGLFPGTQVRVRRISGEEAARRFEGRAAVEVCIGPEGDGRVRRTAFVLGFPPRDGGPDKAALETQARALVEALLDPNKTIQRVAVWPDAPFPDNPRTRILAECRLDGIVHRAALVGPKGGEVVAVLADRWLDGLASRKEVGP